MIKVGVTLNIEGIHSFPNVCDVFGKQVEYLKYPHRHTFIIKCERVVTHTDRDEEFICLKHNIMEFIYKKFYNNDFKLCDFGSWSCEKIAVELANTFNLCRCEVSEDGENYAIVE